MNHITPRRLVAASAIASLAVLSACKEQKDELDDAPVGIIDDAPQFVMTNLDQFPNIAVRCYGGNGIYTTTRDYGDAITIVVSDPECAVGNPTKLAAAAWHESQEASA